jgi:hypothetical protein
MQCPSCKADLPTNTRLCPECGSLVYAGQVQQQRNTDGTTNFVTPPSPYVTKSKWSDVALAVVVCWMGGWASIIGVPIVFFIVRKKYPLFANILGIVWVLGLIVFGIFMLRSRIN